jgi:hypothetical protein
MELFLNYICNMKTITLKVSDEDYELAMVFLQQVKMFKVVDSDDFEIPLGHKKILEERWEAIENGTAKLIDWDTSKKSLLKKYGKA